MRPRTVAIVDDDPAVGLALSRLIRSLGHTPRLFESAEELLGVLAASRPDCVITDMQMPGLNGLDLLRMLKGEQPGLPVIVITAYPSASNRERALAADAAAYLPKPFDADELERRLTAIFDDE